MREAVFIAGICVILVSGIAFAWASVQLRVLESAEEFQEEVDDFMPFDNPFFEADNDEYERKHDFYNVMRIVSVIGIIAGLAIAVYGFLKMEEDRKWQPTTPVRPVDSDGRTHFCQHCGTQIGTYAVWCPGCGRKFKPKTDDPGREQEVR